MSSNKTNVETTIKTEEEILLDAYKNALQQRQVAETNFNNADNLYIDVAIYEYNAAHEKISIIIKQIKEVGANYGRIINL